MSFGRELRKIRKSLRMTQKEVAEQMGISEQAYARYEYLEKTPRRASVERLAEALGVGSIDLGLTPPELASISPETMETVRRALMQIPIVPFESLSAETPEEARRNHRLVTLYKGLNRTGQKKAVDLLTMLSKIPEYQIQGDE